MVAREVFELVAKVLREKPSHVDGWLTGGVDEENKNNNNKKKNINNYYNKNLALLRKPSLRTVRYKGVYIYLLII